MTVKKKISISLDLFTQENSDSFIATFKPEMRILFEDDNWWLMVFFLYLLALPDEQQRIIGILKMGSQQASLQPVLCFFNSKRTFLRVNVIRFIRQTKLSVWEAFAL